MLNSLFRRLTADPASGECLFAAATVEARRPHWYCEGGVPDTIDGRFAVLATIVALILVRLEAEGAAGNALSVALTERFIAVMESEHRELGLGDPALGRTVRKLVGALARRTETSRGAANGQTPWRAAAIESLYRADAPAAAVGHSAAAVRDFWSRLQGIRLDALVEGRLA
jgi:cytochrome b pre-mRNA-processing protein 3